MIDVGVEAGHVRDTDTRPEMRSISQTDGVFGPVSAAPELRSCEVLANAN